MEEQFILRVPPSIAERIERLFNENPSTSEDGSLDLSFTACSDWASFFGSGTWNYALSLGDDGRTGTFAIGNEKFPASLLDLPGVVESYKTYDDTVLIKTADVGQIIMVREEVEPAPEGIEYRHGLTPPMRDARRRRFRREPDLNPELVQRVEKDLLNIMSGGTVERSQADDANGERRKTAQVPAAKPEVVPTETVGDGEPERSDSDDSVEHEN